MTDRFPSQLAEKIVVRLPDGMRDRIAAAAKANNRSSNAEVVARLQASFDDMPRSFDVLRAHHAEVMAMLGEMRRAFPDHDFLVEHGFVLSEDGKRYERNKRSDPASD